MASKSVRQAVLDYLEQGGLLDIETIVTSLKQSREFARMKADALRIIVQQITNARYPTLPTTPVAEPPTPQKRTDSSAPKRPSKRNKISQLESTLTFKDIGGVDTIMQDIKQLVMFPLLHPEVYTELKIEPARGVLLCGSPGTGKTFLAHAICGELGVPFFKIAATEVVSGMSGESEQKIREVFAQAREAAPSVLFIDEIDAITPKRSNSQREMEKRIVAQLLTCMDDCGTFLETGQLVIVLAATNRLEAIDPALRRAGRFDREIHFGIPSETQRLQIIKVLVRGVKTRGDLDLELIAKRTPGYVGADLHSLIKEAGNTAIGRAIEASDQLSLPDLYVEMTDFMHALEKVQPSSKREGFTTIPDTTWQDVGGLESLREELHYSIVHAIEFPDKYRSLGINAAAGVLLYGPPGCGKTLLAKAVANESRANFIAVNGPELLNKYVGESEKAVRQVFQRARDSAPCVVFFDEIDSLCAKRGQDNAATERVVNQFLTELSGFEDRRQVFVIAATNRPDIIDPAMLRPGRLDKMLFVPLPDEADRSSILTTLTKMTPLDPSVNLVALAHQTYGYTGADLASLVREAACFSLRSSSPPYTVSMTHFSDALAKLTPSVTPEQRLHYESIREQMLPRKLCSS